jgi:CRP-like cAMP-binding protein
LPAREIEAIAAVAGESSYRAREVIFREGDPAVWLWLVRTGHVKILRQSAAGKDVVLELLGPGEMFGAVAVLEGRPYPATAQASEDVVVVKLPAPAIVALGERHPPFVREIVRMISRRLRSAHDSVKSLAVDPAESRLAAALLRVAEREGRREGRDVMLPFPLTRQSLADMSGTTVETAIRVIGRWQHDGLIRDADGRLAVLKLDALRALAEGEREGR